MIIPTETSINLWLAWDLELILQCPGSSARRSDESSHEKYALLRVTQWLSRLKGLSFAESPTTFETVFGPWFTVFLSVHFNELSRACQRWRQKLSISLSVTITRPRDLRVDCGWNSQNSIQKLFRDSRWTKNRCHREYDHKTEIKSNLRHYLSIDDFLTRWSWIWNR